MAFAFSVDVVAQVNIDMIGDGPLKTAPGTAKRRNVKRHFKTSSRPTWKLFAKMVSLFVVASGYFILTFILTDAHVSAAVSRLPEQVLAFRRMSQIRLAILYLSDAVTAPLFEDSFRPASASEVLFAMKEQIGEIQMSQDGLLYGSAVLKTAGSVRRYPVRDALNFGNACPFLSFGQVSAVDEISLADVACETLADGVFLGGVNAALQYYMDKMLTMVDQLQTNGHDPNATRITALLASKEYVELDMMERSFLHYGLTADAKLYMEEHLGHGVDFINLRVALLASFLAVISTAYWFIYSPMIVVLDVEVKRVQTLLVMVPFEIVENTVLLKKLLRSQ